MHMTEVEWLCKQSLEGQIDCTLVWVYSLQSASTFGQFIKAAEKTTRAVHFQTISKKGGASSVNCSTESIRQISDQVIFIDPHDI